MEDRVNEALTALSALLARQDAVGVRSLLEDFYEAAQEDVLSDLWSAEVAATEWGVSPRRARAHIARLHRLHGVGRQFGGSWLLRRRDIEGHPPDKRYRASKEISMPIITAHIAARIQDIILGAVYDPDADPLAIAREINSPDGDGFTIETSAPLGNFLRSEGVKVGDEQLVAAYEMARAQLAEQGYAV